MTFSAETLKKIYFQSISVKKGRGVTMRVPLTVSSWPYSAAVSLEQTKYRHSQWPDLGLSICLSVCVVLTHSLADIGVRCEWVSTINNQLLGLGQLILWRTFGELRRGYQMALRVPTWPSRLAYWLGKIMYRTRTRLVHHHTATIKPRKYFLLRSSLALKWLWDSFTLLCTLNDLAFQNYNHHNVSTVCYLLSKTQV